MSTSIPKALREREEFWHVGELARLVIRMVWRRCEGLRWGPTGGATSGRGALLPELQTRGMFLGESGLARFDEFVVECLAAGLLVDDDGVLTLPMLSGDRPKGQRSSAAARKDRQRQLDAAFPERVAERQRKRSAGVTTSVTAPAVTRDSHVSEPVTVSAPSDEGVGDDDEISSSSSSSGELRTRGGASHAEQARTAVSRADVTGQVTTSVALTSHAPAPPPHAEVGPAGAPCRVLLEESKGGISGVCSHQWRDTFEFELGAELPEITVDDLSLVARFCSEKRRLVEAFGAYRNAIAGDVQTHGTVSLQVLRGARSAETGRCTFAPLSDLVRRSRAWQAAERAKAPAARAAPTNDARSAPGPVRAASPGELRKGLAFGGTARRPDGR